MTSLPYEQYRESYEQDRDEYIASMKQRARQLVHDGITPEQYAEIAQKEVKQVDYRRSVDLFYMAFYLQSKGLA